MGKGGIMIWRILFLALLSSAAFAEPIALKFDKVPVVQLVQAVYGEILGRSYVLSPDAVLIEKVISMRVDVQSRDAVPSVLSQVLAFSGLVVTEKEKVYYIDVARTEAPGGYSPGDIVEVYQPRFRSVAYLQALAGVVDRSSQLAFQQPQPVQLQAGQPAANTAQAQPMAVQTQVVQAAADLTQDVMVITGPPDRVEKVMALLEKVDIPAPSVTIRAALVELSTSGDESFNVGLALNLLGSKLGVSLAGGVMDQNFVKIKNSSVEAFVSALEGDTRFRIVTEPRLVVADGHTGKIVVGSEVPTRGAVSYDDNGNALQSIEYRSAGVIFQVTPRIFRDRVLIKLAQQVSNFSRTTTSGIDSPTIIKRDLETVVDLSESQVLLMGGLDENKESASSSGLSFLPDWMRSKSDSQSNTQLMLMLEVSRVPI
ncbi:type II secretion system protein GspD [Azovibrio restrictus]|uniref:type II secretion system protein GspD n=1 Tax=Azovibrio restrictus TaxID=146938 RepID=UPI000A01F934|nr:hypothetical protein [Azovibrio restrictus]